MEILLLKLAAFLVVSLVAAWEMLDRTILEADEEDLPRCRPTAFSGILPILLVLFLVSALVLHPGSHDLLQLSGLCFLTFLHIGIYDLVLLLLLPRLRRRISAKACAFLWLVPNLLYIPISMPQLAPHPLWIIPVSRRVLTVVSLVWLLGAGLIFLWAILSHLRFRRRILKPARPVEDPAVLEVWQEALDWVRLKKPRFRLVISPAVRTPLSIGLFERSTRVVLPETVYTPEELQLVFRHELVHICRGDVSNKFFLLFCTALCWFNPVLWIARRKSSDDLELSCDEAVLQDTDEQTRRQYADLLLKTAGQEQGFTTCLSASATALRYRLKNSIQPRKLRTGFLAVFLLTLALLMSTGQIALACDAGTGAEGILLGQDPSSFQVDFIRDADDNSLQFVRWDDDAFLDYLARLPLRNLVGAEHSDDEDRTLFVCINSDTDRIGVDLSDRTVKVTWFDQDIKQQLYYLSEPLDWALIDDLFRPMPRLDLIFPDGTDFPDTAAALLLTVDLEQNGEQTRIYDTQWPENEDYGTFGTLTYEALVPDFPSPPVGSCAVTMVNTDTGETAVFSLENGGRIPLTAPNLRFHFEAAFPAPGGGLYHAVFLYDLGTI